MKLITAQQIKSMNISPATCVDWVKESFLLKERAQLPPKVSLHPQGNDFFNTMPCILPSEYNRFGLKEVHRIQGAVPSLGSEILLYDSRTGEFLALLDGDWITTMRTGAVACLAIQTFRIHGANYSFIGLGNTARATLLCLLESEPMIHHEVNLLKYKDQADDFIERFKRYENVTFNVFDSIEMLIRTSDVIISSITEANGLLCADDTAFREGCLVVPIHTRGFQNCDLFFDKVYADDTAHIEDFKYFKRFRKYAELSDVLTKRVVGRETQKERILSYNIGLGLHDVLYADKIYNMSCVESTPWPKETRKIGV